MPSINSDVEVHPESQSEQTSPWIFLSVALCTVSLVSLLVFSAVSNRSRAGPSSSHTSNGFCSCFRKKKTTTDLQRYPGAIPAKEWIAQRRAAQNVLNASRQGKMLSHQAPEQMHDPSDAYSLAMSTESPIYPHHAAPRHTLSSLIQTQQRADGKDRHYLDENPAYPGSNPSYPPPPPLKASIRRIGSNIPSGVLEEHVTSTLDSALVTELGSDYRQKSAQNTPLADGPSPRAFQATVQQVSIEPTQQTLRKALTVSHTTNRPKSTVGSALFGNARSMQAALQAQQANAAAGTAASGSSMVSGGGNRSSAPPHGPVYQSARVPILSYAPDLAATLGSSHAYGGGGTHKDLFGASNTLVPIGSGGSDSDQNSAGSSNRYSMMPRNQLNDQSIATARRTIASMGVLSARHGRDVEVSVQSPLHAGGFLPGSNTGHVSMNMRQ